MEQIAARGGSLRRRRRALSAGAGLAAVAAATGAALALPGTAAEPGVHSATASAATALNVDLADFTIRADAASPDVDVSFKQLGDAATLEQYLKQLGVDAPVQEFSLADDQGLKCTSQGPQIGYGVASAGPQNGGAAASAGPEYTVFGQAGPGDAGSANIELDRSNLSAAGGTLQIVYAQRSDGDAAALFQYAGLSCTVARDPTGDILVGSGS